MPKRTNEFQELIAMVYEQIVPVGGKVTESAEVIDKDTGELREVDILVEYRYAHHDFKLAIECRDRSRNNTVQWIDELIGKAGSLNVNKLVAVSKKGFTNAAMKKARAHGIETLTTKEAIETDWEKYPIKPGVLLLSPEHFTLHDVLFSDGNDYRSLKELGLDSIVLIESEELGTVKEVFDYYFQKYLVLQINDKLKADRAEIFRKKDDVLKPIQVESDRTFSGFIVRTLGGDEVDISTQKFIVYGTRQHFEVGQTHIQFNEMMLSTGRHLNSDGSEFQFLLVQDPEKEKIRFKWKRVRSDNP